MPTCVSHSYTDSVSATIIHIENDVKRELLQIIESFALFRVQSECTNSSFRPSLHWYSINLSEEEGPDVKLETKLSANLDVLMGCTACNATGLLWVLRCNTLWPSY